MPRRYDAVLRRRADDESLTEVTSVDLADVPTLDADTRRATVELTASAAGQKVLGRALAVVQLD